MTNSKAHHFDKSNAATSLRRVFTCCFLLAIAVVLMGQGTLYSQSTRQIAIYGNATYNEGVATLVLNDSTLLIIGNTSGFTSNSAIWLGWADMDGVLMYDQLISRQGLIKVNAATLHDSLLYMVGYAMQGGNYQNMLLCIRYDGTVVGEHYWGPAGWSFAQDIEVVTHDTLIVAGGASDTIYGALNAMVYCLNHQGHILWQKDFGGAGNDQFMAVSQGHGQSLIMGGYSGSNSYYGDSALYIAKIDKEGNLLWEMFDDHPGPDVVMDVKKRASGGYVACGQTSRWPQYGQDAFLMLVSEQGDITMVNPFGRGIEAGFNYLLQMPDQTFRAAGFYDGQFSHGDLDFFVQNAMSNGYWSPTLGGIIIGGSRRDIANHLTVTPDGGFVATGTTYSFGPGVSHIMVMKTDSLLNTGSVLPHQINVNRPQQTANQTSITIWPVPATHTLNIELTLSTFTSSTPTHGVIFDITGKTIAQFPVAPLHSQTLQIPVSHLKSGVYFMRIAEQTTRFMVQ